MADDPAPKRGDAAQLLDETIDLIMAGLTSTKIVAFLKRRYTNAPKSTKEAKSLIDQAGQELRRRFTEHADVELEVASSRLNDLYARSLRIQDYKTCLAIQREINHFRKLRDARDAPPVPKPNTDVESTPDHPLKVTPSTIGDRYRQNMGRGAAG